MSTLELKVYEIFKNKLGETEAALVIEYFEAKAEEKLQQKKDVFLTKEDKVDMIKWMFIFWASSVVATLGGLIAIVRFMVTK
jgi:hypothetical protein